MSPSRSSRPFVGGIVDVAPILLGVFPFGVIAGVAAVDAGLSTAQAIAASPMIFAGASQLATMDLLSSGSAAAVVIATALVINSRFAMYSAALSRHLTGLGGPQRVVAAYLLTDQAFAVSVIRYGRESWDLASRFAFYLGAAMGLWFTWMVATVAGVFVGAGVPPEWSLDFAVPLVFLALLFPATRDRGTRTAAIVAGSVAAVAGGLPLNLGLLVAVACGLIAGVAAGRR